MPPNTTSSISVPKRVDLRRYAHLQHGIHLQGRVLEVVPVTKKEMTTSSMLMANDSSAPERIAGVIGGSVTS